MPDGGQHFPALVLNADFRPLSHFPLSVWSWQDAIKIVLLDRVSVLSGYDTSVRSPSMRVQMPGAIALKDCIAVARRPAFTRFNVLLRDGLQCQYCADRRPATELTFDHMIPRSRGGCTTWHDLQTGRDTVCRGIQWLRNATYGLVARLAMVLPTARGSIVA